MLENMTKEELVDEVKRLQSELASERDRFNRRFGMTMVSPDGYAAPATKPVEYDLPETRSGQVPSAQDSTAKEKIAAAAETIEAYQKEVEEEDQKEYAGWCLRITDFEGLKFLFLKSPDDRQMSLPVDTRSEVNGLANRPQVLTQFVSVLGRVNIAGVWPRWWKIEDVGEWFVLSRQGLSYTITPNEGAQATILRDFFKHLNTVRVPSIDEADGA